MACGWTNHHTPRAIRYGKKKTNGARRSTVFFRMARSLGRALGADAVFQRSAWGVVTLGFIGQTSVSKARFQGSVSRLGFTTRIRHECTLITHHPLVPLDRF